MPTPIPMNNGFTLTINDPNNLLGANIATFITDMNYVIGLLSKYIVFTKPLDLQYNFAPASQNPYNNDGISSHNPAWSLKPGNNMVVPLLKNLTGEDANGTAADTTITVYAGNDGSLKSLGKPLWFDPNPQIGVTPTLPAGATDFISIAMIGMIHSLGIISWAAMNAPWNQMTKLVNGTWYYSSPAINQVLGGDLPLAPSTALEASLYYGNTSITYQPVTSGLDYMKGNYEGNRIDIAQLDLLLLRDQGWKIQNYQSLPLVDGVDKNNITGTSASDVLTPSQISSIIAAGEGDDTIMLPKNIGNGNYLLDGGLGNDTVVVTRYLADSDLVKYGTDTLLQNKTGIDGVSLLRSIETVVFAEASVTISPLNADLLIAASVANASLHGGAGNDTLIGFAGSSNSVVTYASASKNYGLVVNGSSIKVQDHRGTDGNDTLKNIQKIQFNDRDIDTSWFIKAATLPAASLVDLTEMYIAYFNRAPDAVGLDYWASRMVDGMSLQQIANSFFVQPETVAAYPESQNINDFVNAVYHNVLNRSPDAVGLKYWTNELQTGSVSKPLFILDVIYGARAVTGAPADALALANKELVGAHFAVNQGLTNTTWAKLVMNAVDGSTASVTAANQLTDSYASTAATLAGTELVIQLTGVAA
ncbi:DUF4214 domain-containing protein [Undibacterium sp. Di26W]|uniref:DUF4214 domain-containing protein n=1 Tax=Undibacterium sp. Di26W TaxID=3413035 RepID=UPI003BF29723